jgi:hypothetical protein
VRAPVCLPPATAAQLPNEESKSLCLPLSLCAPLSLPLSLDLPRVVHYQPPRLIGRIHPHPNTGRASTKARPDTLVPASRLFPSYTTRSRLHSTPVISRTDAHASAHALSRALPSGPGTLACQNPTNLGPPPGQHKPRAPDPPGNLRSAAAPTGGRAARTPWRPR